ncbi:MAG: 16S rRNA (adenine(1518)-N(6)/adenine(1519)-N(6))-dimethyltransferase RsmA [Desulfuromonadaceae bacterium]|jgi:16S rRNA (adenine1518-N6/adenine1519-N6)-dimethyltransferase
MNHRPKKRFGQNFLRDKSVVDRILRAAELQPTDRVLEIGPGLGALTDHLLPRVGRLHVMEVDRDLITGLQARQAPNLTVHAGDALRLDWDAVLTAGSFKLVANLPYNISSQILFKLLDHRQHFSRAVLMFQKEVGDRICSPAGNRDYGALSVFCQLWFDIHQVMLVPPGAFFPPPKVTSVVLLFESLTQPRVAVTDERFFRRVVKGAFAQRRKTLRNNLLAAGFGFTGLDRELAANDIDPGRRGETLDLGEFARLTEILYPHFAGD